MAWYRQGYVDPDICCHMSSLGHNESTHPLAVIQASWILFNIGSATCLFSDYTKLPAKPILAYLLWGSWSFTWRQLYWKYSWHRSLNCVWATIISFIKRYKMFILKTLSQNRHITSLHTNITFKCFITLSSTYNFQWMWHANPIKVHWQKGKIRIIHVQIASWLEAWFWIQRRDKVLDTWGEGTQPNEKYWNMVIFLGSVLLYSLIARFMGPTWGPSGSCRPQMGPMLAPRTLLSGLLLVVICGDIAPATKIFWDIPDLMY